MQEGARRNRPLPGTTARWGFALQLTPGPGPSGPRPDPAGVLTHVTADHDPEIAAAAATVYRSTANPIWPRSHSDVLGMFGTTEPAEPGLVDAGSWRPDDAVGAEHVGFSAGIGRIG